MTQPSYAMSRSKTAEFCSRHATECMVDAINMLCRQPGCHTRPSFGAAGSEVKEFCKWHSKEGMVDVVTKKYARPGCPKYAYCQRKTKFCTQHATEESPPTATNRAGKGGAAVAVPPRRLEPRRVVASVASEGNPRCRPREARPSRARARARHRPAATSVPA